MTTEAQTRRHWFMARYPVAVLLGLALQGCDRVGTSDYPDRTQDPGYPSSRQKPGTGVDGGVGDTMRQVGTANTSRS